MTPRRLARDAALAALVLLAATVAPVAAPAAVSGAGTPPVPAPAAPTPAAQSRPARPSPAPAGAERPLSHEEAQQDGREIRTAIEGLHKALQQFFSDRNIEPVMKYYENLVEYFSPSGQRENRDQIRKRLLSHAPRVKDFRTQVSPLTIHVSHDIGWATCKVHEAYTFDDKAGEEDLISTYILERKPAGWRIVHEHQSLDMSAGESEPESEPTP